MERLEPIGGYWPAMRQIEGGRYCDLKEVEAELARKDEEIDRLREALEVALKTIDYAVGCIEGTIRDYKDELPKKVYEAREALAKGG